MNTEETLHDIIKTLEKDRVLIDNLANIEARRDNYRLAGQLIDIVKVYDDLTELIEQTL